MTNFDMDNVMVYRECGKNFKANGEVAVASPSNDMFPLEAI